MEKEVKSIKLDAIVLMREFDGEDGAKHEYVAVELPNPFDDEDFVDIGIKPRWNDQSAIFKFKAKKALKETESVKFFVELKILEYLDKKSKTKKYYPGMVGVSPFDGREIEFEVKGESQRAVFLDIARDLLGMRPESEVKAN